MNDQVKRAYSFQDLDMLLACQKMCGHFKEHNELLAELRPGWADPFIDSFKYRVNKALENNFSAKSGIHAERKELNEVRKRVLKKLSFFKVQVEVDYEDQPGRVRWILNQLGYTSFYANAIGLKDPVSLCNLLRNFKHFMERNLRNELVQKGISDSLIQSIIAYSNSFPDMLKIEMSSNRTSRKFGPGVLVELNSIFKIAFAISKITTTIFEDKPILRDKFHFENLLPQVQQKKQDKESPLAQVS